jgi:hypothetical protein
MMQLSSFRHVSCSYLSQVCSEVSALEMKKIAAEQAKMRREALQIQRQKNAATTAVMDASLQSAVSQGSEVSGVASFTSPTLGLKAQAAVDSARDVVRRVLSSKVCQSLGADRKRKRCHGLTRARVYSCLYRQHLKHCQGSGGSPRSSVSVDASPPASPIISASSTSLNTCLQSAVSQGSEVSGVASFTSPTLGLKAQAAVDSARDVVRRVLSSKVCQPLGRIASANAAMGLREHACILACTGNI